MYVNLNKIFYGLLKRIRKQLAIYTYMYMMTKMNILSTEVFSYDLFMTEGYRFIRIQNSSTVKILSYVWDADQY